MGDLDNVDAGITCEGLIRVNTFVGTLDSVAPTARSYTSAIGEVSYTINIHPIDAFEPRDAEAAIVRFALETYGESSQVTHVCGRQHWQGLANFAVEPPTATARRQQIELLGVGSAVVELIAEFPDDDTPMDDAIAASYFMYQPDLEELRPTFVPPSSAAEPIAVADFERELVSVRQPLRRCTRALTSPSRYAPAFNDDGHLMDIRQADDAERNVAADECVANVLEARHFSGPGRAFIDCDAQSCRSVAGASTPELTALPRCPPVAIP